MTAAHKISAEPHRTMDPGQTAIRLLTAQLAERSKYRASVLLDQRGVAHLWPEIEQHVEACQAAIADGLLEPNAVFDAAEALLVGCAELPERVTMYREFRQRHVNWELEWQTVLPAEEARARQRASLLWMTVAHLLAAPASIADIRAIFRVPEQAEQRNSAWDGLRWRGRALVDACGRQARSAYETTRAAKHRWHAHRALVVAQEKAAAEKRDAERVQRQAEARQRAEAAQRAVQALGAANAVSPAALRLDGHRLHRSVFGTWFMLVLLSWVSLTWGTLISIPFGVGLGLVATFMLGLIVVPLWGTFWGFVGMSSATSGTLRRMGFTPVEPDHPLTIETARMAKELGLRMPEFGVVDPYNAFAMGIDRDHATVVIGRPLLQSLTEDETLAVIGHELGHVVSGDMRRMMLMRTFQNATVWFGLAQGLKQFARWIICWAAELAILAFSRRREYWADAIGAALVSKEAMIGALKKLEKGPPLTKDEKTHARFMIRGRPFSTHPSTKQRIAALEAETYIRRLPLKR